MNNRKNNRWVRALVVGALSASLALSPVMPAASVAFAASVDATARSSAATGETADEAATGKPSVGDAAQGSAADAAAQDGSSRDDGSRTGGSSDSGASATPRDVAPAADETLPVSRAAASQPAAAGPNPSASSPSEALTVAAPPRSSVTSGCFLASAPDTQYDALADAIDVAQDGDIVYVVSDNLDAGRRAVRSDKDLTITSAAGTCAVKVRFDFAYTQGAKELKLENIAFETKYDAVLWHTRTAPLFTIDGGSLVMGKDASVSYANLNIMERPLADGDGLTCPVRVKKDGSFTMLEGALLQADSTYAVGGNGSRPVRGAAVYVEHYGIMSMRGGTIAGFAKYSGNLQGGAIYNAGDIYFESGVIKDCRATRGGAVYNDSGTRFRLDDGSFEDCTADEAGGAICNESGAASVLRNGAIKRCTSAKGGAVYEGYHVDDSLHNMEITDCGADEGGAVYSLMEPGITVSSCSIKGCKATSRGGAIVSSGGIKIEDTSIVNCSAESGEGGAVWAGPIGVSADWLVDIRHVTISGCSAERGGALYLVGQNAEVDDITITDNAAVTAGSAIAMEGSCDLTFSRGTTTITGNKVSKTSASSAAAAMDCAVAPLDDDGPCTLSIEGTVKICDNVGAGGMDANLSARIAITVFNDLDASAHINIHDGGSEAYKPAKKVATIDTGEPATMAEARAFHADGGNAITTLNGQDVVWAGMCRINWEVGAPQQTEGGWKYYGSLQAALGDIEANRQEKTIEMLVDRYEIRESKTFYTYTIPQDKYVRITTSSASEFANAICTFTFPHTALTSGGGNTDSDAYCIFNVEHGGQLTLDGTNGTDGAAANGLVFDGGAAGDAVEMRKSGAVKQAAIKNEGRCIVNDVTFRGFNSRCDSNNNRIYGLITSYAGTTGNKETDGYYLELGGTTLIEHVKMFGGAVHEIAGGVGVFGGGFKIGPDVVISDCYGPTGGLAVAEGAAGTFAGTIKGCSTLGDNDSTSLSNQGAGGIFMSNDKPGTTGDTTLTIEGGRVLDCVGNTDTKGVSASAGGIYDYGGALKIHGITITGCSTNSRFRNAGGAMSFNTGKSAHASISMDGLCIVKDNSSPHASGPRNLNLSSDTSVAFKTLYIDVTGDLDPNSEVHVWAQYSDGVLGSYEDRNGAGTPFAYAGDGDASKLANLNAFVNDLHGELRGVASYETWKSKLKQASPYPAAIIWNSYASVKATKRVMAGDGSDVTRRFTFKATSSAQGFRGKVFSKNGTEIDSLVTAYPAGSETDDSTFTLADGDYVLFDNIPNEFGSSSLSQITIAEVDGQAGQSSDPTTPYACVVTERNDLGEIATSGAPAWTRPAGAGQSYEVMFENTLRSSSLAIGKTVTGDFADSAKVFTFRLTLHLPEGLVSAAQGYQATLYDADGSATATRYSFTPGTAGLFTLSHGQRIVLSNLPVGTTYDLTEDGATGYAASAAVKTLDKDGSVAAGAAAEGAAGAGLTLAAADVDAARVAYAPSGEPNSVQVINRMPDVAYTDVEDGTPTWIAWLAVAGVLVAGAAAVALTVARKRA